MKVATMLFPKTYIVTDDNSDKTYYLISLGVFIVSDSMGNVMKGFAEYDEAIAYIRTLFDS